MKRTSKIISFLLIIVLCLATFCACGKEKQPQTTEELLVKVKENMTSTNKNCHGNVNIELAANVSLSSEDTSVALTLPMSVVLDFSVVGQNAKGSMTLAGDLTASVKQDASENITTETIAQSVNFYLVTDADKNIMTTYSKNGESAWVASAQELTDNGTTIDVERLFDNDALKNATMSKNENGYTLVAKIIDVLDEDVITDFIGSDSEDDTLDSLGLDIESIIDLFNDVNLTYEFDNAYHLVKVYSGNVELDLASVVTEDILSALNLGPMVVDELKISFNLAAIINQIGEIKAEDVQVPQDVIDSYISEEDDPSAITDRPNTLPTEPIQRPENDGVVSANWQDMDIEIDGVVYKFPYDYNELEKQGWYIDLNKMGYTNGYVLEAGQKSSNTIDLYNNAYVKPDDYGTLQCWIGFLNQSNETKDVKDCDVWAISFDIMHGYAPVEKYPNVKIANGVTFGSTMSDVIAALGEANEVYQSKGEGYSYTTLDWHTDDYAKSLAITVDDVYGVTAIEFSYYID